MDKILVPVDGSPTSEHAAEKAIEVAKKYNSKLTFLIVTKKPDVFGRGNSSAGTVFGSEEYSNELKEEQEETMKDFLEEMNLEGLEYDIRVLVGEPYEEIIEMSEKENYDLIVMGRRGFSKITRFFLGSVSQRVLSGAHCPVLIIPEKKE
ncbi:universal stress protein [Gudongella sp. DL1XJH-153]|uniref:universal stress protein n=1 Tax=Gudongella sp. DL1XJH-153 TaxID=3409804 RepID=UPI003BB63A7A